MNEFTVLFAIGILILALIDLWIYFSDNKTKKISQ